jgi:hypothetical protein
MTDEELLSLNQSGFIPGPHESETDFRQRIESTSQAFFKLGVSAIPSSHWDFVEHRLRERFCFTPSCLPVFYSNRSLRPRQGAAAWVERGQILAIQLRESFRKGTFLGIYQRSEILAHESVHAARSAFPFDPWDEFFAYMTSDVAWRRVLGPIIRSPWEVWPFLIFSLLGVFDPIFFLGSSLWMAFGFYRLIRSHLILRKVAEFLKKLGCPEGMISSLLLRLTHSEIVDLSRGTNIFAAIQSEESNLRLRLLLLMYKERETWHKKSSLKT